MEKNESNHFSNMEKNESNHLNIKLIILEIFPPLEELNDNNSEITICFEDKYNEIVFNLTELLLYQKELDLSFNSKSSRIKVIINKNDNLFASGLLTLKNGDQWVTLSYENKKRHIYSNLTLSLMDCIKLKINCKIMSDDESNMNNSYNLMKKGSSNINSNNLMRKSNHILNQKRRTTPKKLDTNYLTQYSFNIENNKKINKYIESNIKTPIQSPYTAYTTINKNSIKKIELSANQSNKCINKKLNYLNNNNLRNDNIKNISSAYPLNTKNSHKIIYKKKGEDEIIGLSTEIKPKRKNKGHKQSLEDINLNSINKKNKSCLGIVKIENSKSSKNFIKRKSGKNQQINLIGKLYDTNNNINSKEYYNKNLKTEENNYIKKKSSGSEKVNGIKKINQKDKWVKTPNNKNSPLKNLIESNDIENNDLVLNMMKDYKNRNSNNIDKEENIQYDNIIIGNNINETENKLKKSYNNIVNLIDDDINNENDIFFKHFEDFKLLYSDEYIKSITNDYIKL